MSRYLFPLCLMALLVPTVLRAAPFVMDRNAQCVAISADGKLAATGKSGLSDGADPPRPHSNYKKCAVVQIWEIESGKQLWRLETFGDLTKVKFSPDGSRVAAARYFTPGGGVAMNEVRVWNTATGKIEKQYTGCHDFDYAPDGSLAILSRTRCALYNAQGERTKRIDGIRNALSVAFDADGKRIAGVSPVSGGFAAQVCDVASGELIAATPVLKEPFYAVAFSPQQNVLATGHVGAVALWDLDQPQADQPLTLRAQLRTGAKSLAHPFFSPTESILGAGDQGNGDCVFWDLTQGEAVRRYTFQRGEFTPYYPRTVEEKVRPEIAPHRFAFGPAGETFIAGCYGGMIRTLSDGRDLLRFHD